jgi:enoyl-CoA hydratase/3-hydroxyacyl-CoA dehydrogenase
MGHGIAQLAAQIGCNVVIRDVEDRFLDAGLQKIRWSLGKLVEKDRISKEQAELVLRRIGKTTDLKTAVLESDLVIEAVPEELQLKKEIFTVVDEHAPAGAILASNTSSLPIEEIAKATSRPQSVIGMHFFNPPQLMRLVEIVLGAETADGVAQSAAEFARELGKETIVCRKYVPGFVVNNILYALSTASMAMFGHGDATAEEIDSALIFKAGFPMGIFLLNDYSGIDVGYNVQKLFQSRGYPAESFSPFKQMVEEGRLGAKTGHGFYEWKDGRRPEISAEAGSRIDVTPIIASGVNAAAELIRQGVATKEDIDKGIRLGLGFPKGILEMGDETGLDKLLDSLAAFNAKYGKRGREPSPLLVELVRKKRLGKRTAGGFYDYR